jgi:hypothetical protein
MTEIVDFARSVDRGTVAGMVAARMAELVARERESEIEVSRLLSKIIEIREMVRLKSIRVWLLKPLARCVVENGVKAS